MPPDSLSFRSRRTIRINQLGPVNNGFLNCQVAQIKARQLGEARPNRLSANPNDVFHHCTAILFSQTRRNQVHVMIGLGVVLIILGLLLPSLVPTFAFAHLLFVLGVILLIVGALLAVLGRTGHAVGGRRHYY
jgi:hypothetical protein